MDILMVIFALLALIAMSVRLAMIEQVESGKVKAYFKFWIWDLDKLRGDV